MFNIKIFILLLPTIFLLQSCSPKKSDTNDVAAAGAPVVTPVPVVTPTPIPGVSISTSATSSGLGSEVTFSSTTFDLTTVNSATIDSYGTIITAKTTNSLTLIVMPASYDNTAAITNFASKSYFASLFNFMKETISSLFLPSATENSVMPKPKRMAAASQSVVTFTTSSATVTFNINEVPQLSSALTPITTQLGSMRTVAGSNVGTSVAISADGKTMVTGGGQVQSGNPKGKAHVFVLQNGDWVPEGAALVASGGGSAFDNFGQTVAISADGNTILVGAPQDNSNEGATYVFVRSAGIWSQQARLLGTNGVAAQQGSGVTLSANGNTAVIGGNFDNHSGFTNSGSVWVFRRNNGAWTQQGNKLFPNNLTLVASIFFGWGVSISADGKTFAAGAYYLNSVWIFTETNGVWAQEGLQISGTGAALPIGGMGYRVALSADGNTLAASGYHDNFRAGAVWVFTKSSGVWTQQGSKLVPNDAIDKPYFGSSLAISADGNSLLAGGIYDDPNNFKGAFWLFTRTAGVWSQSGSKFIGSGGIWPEQGGSVALSGNAKVGVVGSNGQASGAGAFWIFTP